MKEFRSFAAFAAHLDRLAIEGKEVSHHITEAAAEEIEATAKGMVGEYQQSIGPFAAWEELADSTKADRSRLGYSENDPGFRSGEMQRSIERTVVGTDAAIGSSDQHLLWFDLGTSTQPPRPILGPAAIHATPRILKMAGETTFAWLCGKGWLRPRIKSS